MKELIVDIKGMSNKELMGLFNKKNNDEKSKDIAIIGLSYKLPSSNEMNSFWKCIAEKENYIHDIPFERRQEIALFCKNELYEYQKMAYIRNPEEFDYDFFGMNKGEANMLDPRQRLLLQSAYNAFEDAGYSVYKMNERNIGVYIGAANENTYLDLLKGDENTYYENLPNNLYAFLAARISRVFNLNGPNLVLNTACSSALVAIHTACQALCNRECEMALAGAVNINMIPIKRPYKYNIESVDGITRTFDELSDGTGSGEGVCLFLLRSLEKAIQNRDNIYAIIKGSAINHDGTTMSLTAPDPEKQKDVIIKAWKNAKIDPETITYIEAHGTGTPLGDLVEIEGITKAFRTFTNKRQFCAVSSVKTNFGHLDCAAGAVALLKAIIALQKKIIPPIANFKSPNKKINFIDLPVYINDRNLEWDILSEKPKRCGVSSFGATGTNCHIVLEEYVNIPKENQKYHKYKLFILTAKTKNSLKNTIKKHISTLKKLDNIYIDDYCFTVNTSRTDFSCRLSVLFQEKDELILKLMRYIESDSDCREMNIYYSSHGELENYQKSKVHKLIETCVNTGMEDKDAAIELCKLCSEGYIAIDMLYQNICVKRIPVPIYQFERNTCWLPVKTPPIYYLKWVEKPVRANRLVEENIMVIGEDVITNEIINKFNQRYSCVLFISFKVLCQYMADKMDDYLANFIIQNKVTKIVNLLPMQSENLSYDKQREYNILESFLYLYKQINKTNNKNMDFICFTKNAQVLPGDNIENVNPIYGILEGMTKVSNIENYAIRIRCVDMDDLSEIDCILKEITYDFVPYCVAYRKGTRYAPVLDKYLYNKQNQNSLKIKKDGTYIITGGMSQVGLEIMQYLSNNKVANICLINRTAYPPRDKWDNLVEQNDRLSLKLKKIKLAEEKGTKVFLFQADVTDQNVLDQILNTIRREIAKPDGIFHCTGMQNNKENLLLKDETIDHLLLLGNSKILGTNNIDYLTQNDDLDFIVLFSSVATLAPNAGTSAYVAACTYMNLYASKYSNSKKHVISINWPIWQTEIAEREIRLNNEITNKIVFKTIFPWEAEQALSIILKQYPVNTFIGYLNDQSPVYQMTELLPLRLSDELTQNISDKKGFLQPAQIDQYLLSYDIQTTVIKIFEDILGIMNILTTDNFYDLGGDSIKAMKICNRIQYMLMVNILISDLLQYPIIEDFISLIKTKANNKEYHNIEKEKNDIENLQNLEIEAMPFQKRIYATDQLDPSAWGYNILKIFSLRGSPDIKKIKEAFVHIAECHDVFSYYFCMKKGILYMVRHNHEKVLVKFITIKDNELEEYIKTEIKPIDLSQPPLLRIYIFKLDDDQYKMIIHTHHIIYDGVTEAILTRSLNQYYNTSNITKPTIGFIEYIKKYNMIRKSDLYLEKINIWKTILEGEIQALDLPLDYARSSIRSYNAESVIVEIDINEIAYLTEFLSSHNITPFMFFLSVFHIQCMKYTGQTDISIGIPISGRSSYETENTMGLFVNTLVYRLKTNYDSLYSEFIKNVKNVVLLLFSNQDVLLDDIIDIITFDRDAYRNPVYDVTFTMQNVVENFLEFKDFTIELESKSKRTTQVDLGLEVFVTDATYKFEFVYNTALFRKETIKTMAEHYLIILKSILQADMTLYNIPFLSQSEWRQSVDEGINRTQMPYPMNKSVYKIFQEQCNANRNKIAVIDNVRSLDYDSLNNEVANLARIINIYNIGAQSIIPIIADQDSKTIIAMMAVLMTKNAYVLIDCDLPEERIKMIIDDTASEYVILATENGSALPDNIKKIRFPINPKGVHSIQTFNEYEPSDLAYVVYTSGTTGVPQGVMIENKSIINLVYGLKDELKLSSNDVFLSITPVTFDIFVFETILPLLLGATIRIPGKCVSNNMSMLENYLIENDINIVQMTPSRLNLLIQQRKQKNCLSKISKFIIGGEPFPLDLLNDLQKNTNAQIFNVYGPSETTVWSSYKELTASSSVTIGKPIKNTKIFIINSYGELQMQNVVGEIHIGGDGLFRGYLNNIEKTVKKTIRIPSLYSGFLYKTGDIGKYLPQDELTILGRIDSQIKLRGYRIELSEIEKNILKEFSFVEKAVVVDKIDQSKNQYLHAYLILRKKIENIDFRNRLRHVLPEYMIPEVFEILDSFPITPHGKIDRKELKNKVYYKKRTDIIIIPPETEFQKQLLNIWKKILETDQIGIDNNFFSLKGNSLHAIQIVSMLSGKFGWDIPMNIIFKHPTVRELCDFLEKQYISVAQNQELKVINETRYVTTQQEWIYTAHTIRANTSTQYNMPNLFSIPKFISFKQIQKAVAKLIERHEILKSVFFLQDGKVSCEFATITIQDVISEEFITELEDANTFILPFDLKKGPLFRVKVFYTNKSETCIFFDIHHIIADEISIAILMKDFFSLLSSIKPSDYSLPYSTFAKQQNNTSSGSDLAYWVEKFKNESLYCEMFYDHPKKKDMNMRGKRLTYIFPIELTEQINTFLEHTQSTVNMFFISLLSILLYKYTGETKPTIGFPISAERSADFINTVGPFINTIVLKNILIPTDSYLKFYNCVKENCLVAYIHPRYKYDDLINALDVKRQDMRDPLFNIMLVIRQENELYKECLDIMQAKTYDLDKFEIKTDLTIYVYQETKGPLTLTAEYAMELFDEKTILNMFHHLMNIAQEVVYKPDKVISTIKMLCSKDIELLTNSLSQLSTNFVSNISLCHMIEAQVLKSPDSPAVVYGKHILTYQELNEAANTLARYLLKKGVKPGQRVAIDINRNERLIIGILAILKIACTYVPIDLTLPKERVQYQINQANCIFLITDNNLEDINISTIEYKQIADKYDDICKINLDIKSDLSRELYVIYTSGSTALPNAVSVKENSFVNLLEWYIRLLNLNDKSRVLLIAAMNFDLAQKNVFASLMSGAILHIYPSGMIDYNDLSVYISQNNIEVINCTPSMFYPLLDFNCDTGYRRISNLKHVVLGGENIIYSKVNPFLSTFKNRIKIYNTYGPTECTDIATCYVLTSPDLENESIIPIGKPIDNVKTYIINSDNSLIPYGRIGELAIGGISLSNGYINNKTLNDKKFITFSMTGEQLYKTGDMVKLNAKGELIFIGRKDFQVKIRGYRIELSEIEDAIKKYYPVKDVVVLLNDFEQLIAFYTGNLENEEQIKKRLIFLLPSYAIPDHIVFLESLPLNHNGKIDYSYLKSYAIAYNDDNSIDRKMNKIEKLLYNIWQEVLEIKDFNLDKEFFELGGNSIKLIYLHEKINKLYPDAIGISDLFIYPTVESQSNYILKKILEKQDISGVFLKKEYQCNNNQAMSVETELSLGYNIKKQIDDMKNHFDTDDILAAFLVFSLYEAVKNNRISLYFTDRNGKILKQNFIIGDDTKLLDIVKQIHSTRHRIQKVELNISSKITTQSDCITILFSKQEKLIINELEYDVFILFDETDIDIKLNYFIGPLATNDRLIELLTNGYSTLINDFFHNAN